MEDRIVAPHPSTPAPSAPAGAGVWWMPADVLEQTCKRVGIAALVFAAVWAWVLVMNNLSSWLFTDHAHQVEQWTAVGNTIGVTGLFISLAMMFVAGRLHHEPEKLLDVGLGFEVLTAALIGAHNWWNPWTVSGMGVSWICVIIVFYPAIVPASARKVLAASVIAASMDPLWYLIGLQRGVEYGLDGLSLLWAFTPNYVCALLAVVPARIIRGLGRRVSRARELGSYRLGELVGQGGMGAVHRATHRLLARPAAIKLIRPEVLGGGSASEADVVVERFRREAHAAANLRSPHTIELYDFGVADDGSLYYVMELLEGLDLHEMVERFGPLTPARVVHLLGQACLSLGEAHEQGLVHRDIKPSNLVACRMGLTVDFMKVLDFGLVKRATGNGAEQTRLTSPNVTTGTPAFMAPEVALGNRPVDRRADIYALGCVGYWLLTGRTVFEAPTAMAMLMRHVQDEPTAPSSVSELNVSPELDRIILDCLAKDPSDRPDDATVLYRRLYRCPLPAPWDHDQALAWWSLHLPDLLEPQTDERQEEAAEAATVVLPGDG